jgi:hypothetical protein
MNYFDVHLGLPSPDLAGLNDLLRHVENEKGMQGGNLILNTEEEVELVFRYLDRLPPGLSIIPLFSRALNLPEALKRSGWFKIHPRLHRVESKHIAEIVDAIQTASFRPRGMVVCCYPWGADLKHNISLPLVIEIARAFPEMPVLATHGGGYESWQFRAHAGSLKNVVFDFSATMRYYARSDLLRPFQRYLLHSPDRILFGSDWPGGDPSQQIAEQIRLAEEVSISAQQLEELWLANATRLWPDKSGWVSGASASALSTASEA